MRILYNHLTINACFLLFYSVPDSNAKCSVDTSGLWMCSSGHGNFSCTLSDNRISCLDKQHCSYAEESKQICVTVFVSSQHFLLEEYVQCFYLSEIGENSLEEASSFVAFHCFGLTLVFCFRLKQWNLTRWRLLKSTPQWYSGVTRAPGAAPTPTSLSPSRLHSSRMVARAVTTLATTIK